VYLSYGLAVILGFIGVKLILHALHENNLPFLNGGQPIPVPEVSIAVSLGVIIGVLAITTVASLIKARKDPSAVHESAAAPQVIDEQGHVDRAGEGRPVPHGELQQPARD